MNNSDFPFHDAPNTACLTCCHILEKNKAIRYISHDEDGFWQFLCGKAHKEKEARIVALAEILERDASIEAFSHLNFGEYAEWSSKYKQWIIQRKSSK